MKHVTIWIIRIFMTCCLYVSRGKTRILLLEYSIQIILMEYVKILITKIFHESREGVINRDFRITNKVRIHL